jgi:hypothetical protein
MATSPWKSLKHASILLISLKPSVHPETILDSNEFSYGKAMAQIPKDPRHCIVFLDFSGFLVVGRRRLERRTY